MPKKVSVSSKSEAARERKSAAESERQLREAREKEEKYWREAEGSKSKAAKKREEESKKRAEAAARRAEARRLADLEEKEIAKLMIKPDKKAIRVSVVPKVTEVELRKRREEEQTELAKKAEEVKKRLSRTAAAEEYERIVLVKNTNRDDSLIEARSVEEAIAQMTMSIAKNLPVDRHPERRIKASYKAFEEAELSGLKEEKPGLTLTQYKDMIRKLWKKSPDNPLNQIAG